MMLLWLWSCNTPDKCTITAIANTHDVDLSWSASEADRLQIAFENESRQLEIDGSTQWLAGLPPLETVTVQLLSGSDILCSSQFETTGLPPDLPLIAQDRINGAPSWKGILGTTMGEDSAAWLIDNQGRFRWHSPVEADRIVSDIHSTTDHIWHNSANTDAETPDSYLVQKDFLGVETDMVDTPYGHHVFHLHEDGRIAQLEVDIRPWFNPQSQTEEMVAGDRVVIIEPDGSQRELFSLWDHMPPNVNPHWNSGFYGSYKDWSHANSLNYSADRNSYLIAFANLDQIFEIDATTGEVLLVIDAQQWFFTYESPPFHYPHGPAWIADNQLILFSHAEELGTAVVYEVDADAKILETLWSYSVPISAGFLGQAIPLPSGHTLINFGGAGMLHEVDANGQLIWQAETSLGTWFGNIEVLHEWPNWQSP